MLSVISQNKIKIHFLQHLDHKLLFGMNLGK